ncbi:alpha/beta fold hydrolase [Krasilnikovia sp. MM14-A1259]|uniref:alpha/beta fold hydrolase n=1 Tax=Krasilnikovia sp. MM14-A1259 TaxID=3373539 RepID=UPI0037F39C58
METITSADGTTIAYRAVGAGPPLIVVAGAFHDHTVGDPLAAALAGDHTVVGYDRRARGRSGDTRPYAIDREVEDLAAVIDAAGGRAAVFGYSSGGVLALRAASAGPAAAGITHLALYEPPFLLAQAPPRPADLPARLDALVQQGRRGDAVALFQTEAIGLAPETVAQLRQSPMWTGLEALAQSVVYDATITTELAVPTPAMTAVRVPTVVLNGAATWPWLAQAAGALAASLPAARHTQVPGGENHGIPAEATAAVLRSFLAT